jgi:hypothetical protein
MVHIECSPVAKGGLWLCPSATFPTGTRTAGQDSLENIVAPIHAVSIVLACSGMFNYWVTCPRLRVSFSPCLSLDDFPDLVQRQRLGFLPRNEHGLAAFRVQVDHQEAGLCQQERQDMAFTCSLLTCAGMGRIEAHASGARQASLPAGSRLHQSVRSPGVGAPG